MGRCTSAGTLLMTPIGSRAASRDSIRGVMAIWRFMPRNYLDFSDYEDSSDSHSFQPLCISVEAQRSVKDCKRTGYKGWTKTMNTPLPWQHTRKRRGKRRRKRRRSQTASWLWWEVNFGIWGPEPGKGIDTAWFSFNFFFIRTITKSSYNAHTEPLFQQLNILPLEKIILHAKLTFMHSVYYEYSPTSFSNTWTTQEQRHPELNLRNATDIYLPFPRIELY